MHFVILHCDICK